MKKIYVIVILILATFFVHQGQASTRDTIKQTFDTKVLETRPGGCMGGSFYRNNQKVYHIKEVFSQYPDSLNEYKLYQKMFIGKLALSSGGMLIAGILGGVAGATYQMSGEINIPLIVATGVVFWGSLIGSTILEIKLKEHLFKAARLYNEHVLFDDTQTTSFLLNNRNKKKLELSLFNRQF